MSVELLNTCQDDGCVALVTTNVGCECCYVDRTGTGQKLVKDGIASGRKNT